MTTSETSSTVSKIGNFTINGKLWALAYFKDKKSLF